MSHIRRLALAAIAVALGVAIQLSAAPIASAHDSRPHGSRLVAITHPVDGKTGGQLLGQLWYLVYSLPAPVNPWAGNGDLCQRLGGTGRVLLPHGGADCTVDQGTPVLVFGWSTTCDNIIDPAVDPGGYGADAAAQRKCAVASDRNAPLQAINVTVDDGGTVNIKRQRYEVISPQRQVQLPPDNLAGISPRAATFTAHGWVALLTHLTPGRHTLRIGIVFPDGTSERMSVINVVRHDDDHELTNN